MNTRRPLFIAALPLIALLTGCTSLSLKKPDVWPLNISDNKPGVPDQMVSNWTDTVMYQGAQAPVRGFGGRLLFYAEGKKDPIKVDGDVVVYAFDERNRDPNSTKPDRKFVFTKDQLTAHYSKSKIGHSYSLWLPWDEAGGEQREISLIVRFMPENGNVLVGDPSKHILPGKTGNLTGNANSLVATQQDPIQRVSFDSPLTSANGNMPAASPRSGTPQTMHTTTINIPRSSVLSGCRPANDAAGASPTQPPCGAGVSPAQPACRVGVPPAAAAAVAPQQRVPEPPSMIQTTMPAAQSPGVPPSAFGGRSIYPVGGSADFSTGIAQGANTASGTGTFNSISPYPPNLNCQPLNRFGQSQSRVPGVSIAPPTPYRASWQPYPSAPPFGPAALPGSPTSAGYFAPPAVGGSATN